MADANPIEHWTRTAAGALDWDHVNERALYFQVIEAHGGDWNLFWTDDGLLGGNSLFSATVPPFVSVVARDMSDGRLWSQAMLWGGAWPQSQVDFAKGQFEYSTSYGGPWQTLLRIRGGSGNSGSSDATGGGRVFVAWALGLRA